MVADPDWPAAGVTVTVRLAPEPPSTMLETGTSVVFDDVRETSSDPAAVSASPTVNATAPVDWPADTVTFALWKVPAAPGPKAQRL